MMKGRVSFMFLLHVALASTLSGCRTADVTGGRAVHRAALQALSSRSCKIMLKKVHTPPDRPEKLRTQQTTGSYLITKGDEMSAYLTREDNSPKLSFGSSPLNDGETALQMDVPEMQKSGDANIILRVQGNAHYRIFERNMMLYHDSSQCFVQASKVYMAGNFNFKEYTLPSSEK